MQDHLLQSKYRGSTSGGSPVLPSRMPPVEQARRQFDQRSAELRPELWSYARRMLGNAADADDALQEALVRGWRSVRSGRVPENDRSWLFTILHHEVLRVLGRRQGLGRLLAKMRATFREDRSDAPPDSVGARIAALPFPMSAVILLRFTYDFSYPEISEILDLPGGTVRASASRGLEKLRKELVKP